MKTGVITNGIGKTTTAHLNLTTTLADAWAQQPMEAVRVKPRNMGRPPGPNLTRPRFAGDEQYEGNAV